jgi:hypothetical protein
MRDGEDPIDTDAPGAGDLFALAARAGAIWRQELDDELTKIEEFCEGEMAKHLAEGFGLDQCAVATIASARFRELRAAIADARKARREVLDEEQRGAST